MFSTDDDKAGSIQSPVVLVAVARRTAARVLPARTASVPALRGFARGVVHDWALSDRVEEAVALAVTELVANAVQHSGSRDVGLRISLDDRAVTVEVRDHGQWRSPTAAAQLAGIPERCSGRGLSLVNAYTSGCVLWYEPDGTRAVAKIPLSNGAR
ncbi:ATP-binding protein [Kitasatospora sp. NPDC058965]|uniref:ATP-binding protein n=1 Tax=Kitasatospora sp. NPDC058965 TaxID=3346682 RepID=UPI00367B0965